MKLVVVVNGKSTVPVQVNAACHLCVGMREVVRSSLQMRSFVDANDSVVSVLTDFPLIVFSARNGDHLREAHRLAMAADLPCSAFFDCMRSGDPERQAEKVRSAPVGSLDYIALALFGSQDQLKPITRQFSLMREAQVDGGQHVVA
jgi:hypothetical protein